MINCKKDEKDPSDIPEAESREKRGCPSAQRQPRDGEILVFRNQKAQARE